MKKSLTAGLSAVALVASAASVALVSSSPAHAADEPSSAFGIEAVGAIPIDAMPYVESTDGELVTDELAEIPADPLLNAGVITVEAANGYARAEVAGLTVGDDLLAQLPAEITDALDEVCGELADALLDPLETDLIDEVDSSLLGELETVLDELADAVAEGSDDAILLGLLAGLDLQSITPEDLAALCDALNGSIELVSADVIWAECNGTTGDSQIAGLKVLGLPIDVQTEPNSELAIEGLLSITTNKQTANADGTFTVEALVIDLFDGEQIITVAHATCGEVAADAPPPVDEPDAPAPIPGPGDTAVTG